MTRGKLDLDTKMVIFATAEEDYIAIVEKNMELYAKLDFLGQQAEDMLEEAIEKERVKSPFDGFLNHILFYNCNMIPLRCREEALIVESPATWPVVWVRLQSAPHEHTD